MAAGLVGLAKPASADYVALAGILAILAAGFLLLARIIRHPEFISGQVDTKFLERHPELLRPEE